MTHAAARSAQSLLAGLAPLEPVINGDPARSVPYILNLSFPGLDAETAIDAWSDLVAISNGAACTSQSYTCSHVLSAMRLPEWRKDGALRFSWCADSPETRLERPGGRRRTLSRHRKGRDRMSAARDKTVYYRRSRFTTHLPIDCRYSPAHYWLLRGISRRLAGGLDEVCDEDARRHRRVRVQRGTGRRRSRSATRSVRSKG